VGTVLLAGCVAKPKPYADGPVMNQKNIQKTFRPILEFMEVKPGMVFADVGAGSGAITVMMASLMDSATVYVQDIDSTVLNKANFNKIIHFYTRKGKQGWREKTKFSLILGSADRTHLPDTTIDLIYTNATMHAFDSPTDVLIDLRQKLKPNGRLFIRESFKNHHGEGDSCKQCRKLLLSIDDFLVMMEKNGFRLIKQAPNMSGYPIFGFALAQE
jgi:ubiquinone/menaquinone biosynthesis C-methylase UbiE